MKSYVCWVCGTKDTDGRIVPVCISEKDVTVSQLTGNVYCPAGHRVSKSEIHKMFEEQMEMHFQAKEFRTRQ